MRIRMLALLIMVVSATVFGKDTLSGYIINSPLDPPPWGTVENTFFRNVIDKVGHDSLGPCLNVDTTGGKRFTHLDSIFLVAARIQHQLTVDSTVKLSNLLAYGTVSTRWVVQDSASKLAYRTTAQALSDMGLKAAGTDTNYLKTTGDTVNGFYKFNGRIAPDSVRATGKSVSDSSYARAAKSGHHYSDSATIPIFTGNVIFRGSSAIDSAAIRAETVDTLRIGSGGSKIRDLNMIDGSEDTLSITIGTKTWKLLPVANQ